MTSSTPAPAGSTAARAAAELRKMALALPESVEQFPWGHSAFKVPASGKPKTFLFVAASTDGLSLSAKLPESAREALLLPFAEPTGYGLGKSNWVTATFAPDAPVPVSLLAPWIEESFRAVAPKRVVAALDGAAPAKPKQAVAKRPSRKA